MVTSLSSSTPRTVWLKLDLKAVKTLGAVHAAQCLSDLTAAGPTGLPAVEFRPPAA
jgi:hypothetical protein